MRVACSSLLPLLATARLLMALKLFMPPGVLRPQLMLPTAIVLNALPRTLSMATAVLQPLSLGELSSLPLLPLRAWLSIQRQYWLSKVEQDIYSVHRDSSRIRAATQVIERVQDAPRIYY